MYILFVYHSELQSSIRGVLVQGISKERSMNVLPQSSRCLLHFIDISDMNIAAGYLKAAWESGSTGSSHFYLVKAQNGSSWGVSPDQKMAYIFDFKRLFIALPLSVSKTNH